MATKYASPSGDDDTGDGSLSSPYATLRAALDAATAAGADATVIALPGTYTGLAMTSADAGTAGHPTVVKSSVKWGAVVSGRITSSNNADYITVDGFQVIGNAAAIAVSLNSGDHVTVRNLWVHGNGRTGILVATSTNVLIEYCLSESNGSSATDHGIYVHADEIVVRSCVCRNNIGWGIHAYQDGAAGVTNCDIYNNICYGNPRGAILVKSPESLGGGTNTIINNTCKQVVGSVYAVIHLWYGNAEVIRNNIVIAGENPLFALDHNTSNTVIDNNMCSVVWGGATNAVTYDAMFYSLTNDMLWLSPGGNAIGAGSLTGAPSVNFWGDDVGETIDVGAMPYTKYLHPRTMLHDPWSLTKVRRRWWNWRRREQKLVPA